MKTWHSILLMAAVWASLAVAEESESPGTAAAEPLPTVEADAPASASATEEAEAPHGNRLIEEIIVTAQKREEDAQDVPISIAAFSADKLDAIGVENALDLTRVTPGLQITQLAGFNLIYLRGVGTDAFLPSADAAVPLYIDGVNLLAGQGLQNALGRIERIEILKGPQGTLFGRNSTGGAISIITPRAGGQFEGSAMASIGRFNERNLQAFVNVPLTDTFGMSVTGFTNHRDPQMKRYIGDVRQEVPDDYFEGGRVKLSWSPLDNLTFDLWGSYTQEQAVGSLLQENTRPAAVLGSMIPADDLDRHAYANYDRGYSKVDVKLASFSTHWTLPWFDTKLITSAQKLQVTSGYDYDVSDRPLVGFFTKDQFGKQRTAEFQVLSNDDTPGSDRFNWVAGVYYLESDAGFKPALFFINSSDILFGTGPFGGTPLSNLIEGNALLGSDVAVRAFGILDTKSLSFFAQGTYKLADWLELTLGGRFQKETRGINNSRLEIQGEDVLFVPIPDVNALSFSAPDIHDERFTPRVALQWIVNDVTRVYTSWSIGYKSPTYNTVNFFSPPDRVKAERVESVELGVKSDLFDGTLRANAAAFHTDIKNFLSGFVSLTSGGVVRYYNAGAAEIWGLEYDLTWQPMPNMNPGLALTSSATWLDPKYTDFTNGRGFDPNTGLAVDNQDYTGNQITRTAPFTLTMGANQAIDIPTGRLEFGADWYHNGGFYFTPQNDDYTRERGYDLFNVRVSWFYDPWSLQVTAFGENVTDEKYLSAIWETDFGVGSSLGPPRTYGLRLNWTF